ncbi:hypothetical protein ACHAXR_009002 [Thalassiosira sp. AJA248-18]
MAFRRAQRRNTEIIEPLGRPKPAHRHSNSWTLEDLDCFSDDDDSSSAQSLAEQLTGQSWHEVGIGPYPIGASNELSVMVDQLSSILASRLRDLLVYWMQLSRSNMSEGRRGWGGGGGGGTTHHATKKNSTPSCSDASCKNNTAMEYLRLDGKIGDYVLVDSIQTSIREYVTSIGKLYNQVDFHSIEHCTHMTISMNKLLSMVTVNSNFRDHMKRMTSFQNVKSDRRDQRGSVANFSFGIGEDPRILFAMVFSALIHDVGHVGVPNSVLVEEEDELAILHNDVSVAEQNSLQVAFSLLQKDEFANLKRCICPTPEERKFFRTKVIGMVMVTDISDQERLQIVKSRWNAAFPSCEREGVGGAGDNSSNTNGSSNGDGNGAAGGGSGGKDESSQNNSPRRLRPRTEIQSTELKASIRRRRFTMFATDEAAQEFANEHRSRRLGIRTSMDFSGMLLDAYRTMDQLQQHAVLETMMNVADVAHTMQTFQIFVKWNKRLFKEFYIAHMKERLSFNPEENWYENQIGFFSHYIIPLSQKMKICGVFGTTGDVFQYFAMENKKRWMEEGEAISEEIIRDVKEEVEREQRLSNGCH